ncbi:alpha/beta hydrolase [Portibacter marinus]|uniref:alpha/beta hydrolase n=1 Tax=Portibacter marinus TaxID=2898660 RepID=UPI001F3B989B|nr:alpha/beta hydrolase [Portibacter marinus]
MNKNLIIGTISLLLFVSACSYLPDPHEPIPDVMITETADYIFLKSAENTSSETLFLYYPGGLVDPHAYISMLNGVVKSGYPVLIIKVTGNLAIANVGKARKIVEEFTEFNHYVLGGHSLGAAVSCIAAARDKQIFDGLVIMAGYPTENASLADWDQGTLLVFDASHDEIINRLKLEEAKAFFPQIERVDLTEDLEEPTAGKTIWVEISGGNHSQYGDYGFQHGDGEATISMEMQHELLRDFMLEFFKVNGW